MEKYEIFCKTLKNLHQGAKLQEPYTIIEQTGIAKLLDLCFQQSGKVMKDLLKRHGKIDPKTHSLPEIFNIAYQNGMIQDIDSWLKLLEIRDDFMHTSYLDSDEKIFKNPLTNPEKHGILIKSKNRHCPFFSLVKGSVSRKETHSPSVRAAITMK